MSYSDMDFGRKDINLEAKLFTVKVKFSGQISMYFMNLKWQPFWIPIWPPSVANLINGMLKTSVDNHWKVFLMPPSKLTMN